MKEPQLVVVTKSQEDWNCVIDLTEKYKNLDCLNKFKSSWLVYKEESCICFCEDVTNFCYCHKSVPKNTVSIEDFKNNYRSLIDNFYIQLNEYKIFLDKYRTERLKNKVDFKVGDKLQCMWDMDLPCLKTGDIYTVLKVYKNQGVYLEEVEDGGLFFTNFFFDIYKE